MLRQNANFINHNLIQDYYQIIKVKYQIIKDRNLIFENVFTSKIYNEKLLLLFIKIALILLIGQFHRYYKLANIKFKFKQTSSYFFDSMLCFTNYILKKSLSKTKSINQKKTSKNNTKISLLDFKKKIFPHQKNCKQKNNKLIIEQRKTVPNIQISKSPSISKYSLNTISVNKNKSLSLNRIRSNNYDKKKTSNKCLNNQKKVKLLQKNKNFKQKNSLSQNKSKWKKSNNSHLMERKTHVQTNKNNNICNVSSSLSNLKFQKDMQSNSQMITVQADYQTQKMRKNRCKNQSKKYFQQLKSNLKKKKKKSKQKVWKSSKITCLHSRNNSQSKNYQSKLNTQIKTRYQRQDILLKQNDSHQQKYNCKRTQQNDLYFTNQSQQKYNSNQDHQSQHHSKVSRQKPHSKVSHQQPHYSNIKFVQIQKNSFVLTTLRSEVYSQKLNQPQLKTNNTIIKFFKKDKNKIKSANLNSIQRNSLFSFKKQNFLSENLLKNNQIDILRENEQFQTSIQQRMTKEHINNQCEQSSKSQFHSSFRVQCQQSLQERLIKNGIMSNLINEIKQNEFILSREIHQNSKTHIDNKYKYQSTQSSISSGIIQNAKQELLVYRFILNEEEQKLRVKLIDWISLICQGIMLKRQTFHLAIIYFDSLYQVFSDKVPMKLLFFSCLIVSIKMQERQSQQDLLNILIEFQPSLKRQELILVQRQIIIQFKSNLKKGTLVFWIDYFSKKWDQFVKKNMKQDELLSSILFRIPDAKSYENYRRVCQIIDTLIMNQKYSQFNLSDLGLIAVYIVIIQRLKLKKQKQQKRFSSQVRLKEQKRERTQSKYIQNKKTNNVLVQVDNNGKNICQQFETKKKEILGFIKEENHDNFKNINIINKINKVEKELSNNIINNTIQERNQSTKYQTNINLFSESQQYFKLNQKEQQINHESIENETKQMCQESQFNSKLRLLVQEFIEKFSEKNIQEMKQIIQFQKSCLNTNIPIQIDFKIFQESKNYEDFLRSHTYLPELKDLFIHTLKD